MKRLLQIEFLKLKSYRIFWILVGLYFLLMVLAMLGFSGYVESIFGNSPFSAGIDKINHYPMVWNYMTYIAGFFHLILGVIIIIITCNEYGYKTVRQNVINGLSRFEFLMSKFLMILVFSLASTLVVFAVTFLLGLIHSEAYEMKYMTDKMAFIPGYFVQIMGYSMIAFVIGLIVRRTGFAIGFLMLYVIAVEKIAAYYTPEPLDLFYPVEALDNMIAFPLAELVDLDVPPIPYWRDIGISVAYIIGFGALSVWILKRRDI